MTTVVTLEVLFFSAGLLGYSPSLINIFIKKKKKKEKLSFLLLLKSIFNFLYAWQTLSVCWAFHWTGSIQRVNVMKNMRIFGFFEGAGGWFQAM